jgi:hypothetical protein
MGRIRSSKGSIEHSPLERKTFRAWDSMLQRCNNKNNDKYPRYGGRGIKVCDRWKLYRNFLEDMGVKPSMEFSLHRIDNDGDYKPSNCKWGTVKEQAANKTKKGIHTLIRFTDR